MCGLVNKISRMLKIVDAMAVCSVVFVFFQAEDGIRDLVRSRGLGDVYKRQDPPVGARRRRTSRPAADPPAGARLPRAGEPLQRPVSYTHLTLPTSDLV